jgi:hypothetical protein
MCQQCPTATRGPTLKRIYLLPLPFLSLPSFINIHPSSTVKALSPPLFHLSLLPWRTKVSTKEKLQD